MDSQDTRGLAPNHPEGLKSYLLLSSGCRTNGTASRVVESAAVLVNPIILSPELGNSVGAFAFWHLKIVWFILHLLE